ncbi:MAG: 50S ribosomal protein L11 methyltransferase [Acidimicrobiia bacterium]
MSGYDDSAIGSFDFHHSMLSDSVRTESFMQAILKTVQSGDVVVDIGCGTGVLSMFAAMAGARHVYAIEREDIIGVASDIASANGLSDRVTFIHGASDEIELPELADVVISETIGNVGFDEGIIEWAVDAKARLSKPEARFIPIDVGVQASVVEVPHDVEMVQRWSEPLLSLDFSPLRRLAVNNVMWAEFSPVALLAEPANMISARIGEVPELDGAATLRIRRKGTIHGLGVWFTSSLSDEISITNRPPNAVPSWEQGLFPLEEPIAVAKGDEIPIALGTSRDGSQWTWAIGSQHMTTDRGKLPQVASD